MCSCLNSYNARGAWSAVGASVLEQSCLCVALSRDCYFRALGLMCSCSVIVVGLNTVYRWRRTCSPGALVRPRSRCMRRGRVHSRLRLRLGTLRFSLIALSTASLQGASFSSFSTTLYPRSLSLRVSRFDAMRDLTNRLCALRIDETFTIANLLADAPQCGAVSITVFLGWVRSHTCYAPADRLCRTGGSLRVPDLDGSSMDMCRPLKTSASCAPARRRI